MAPEVRLGGILARSETSRAQMPFLRGPDLRAWKQDGQSAQTSAVVLGNGAQIAQLTGKQEVKGTKPGKLPIFEDDS